MFSKYLRIGSNKIDTKIFEKYLNTLTYLNDKFLTALAVNNIKEIIGMGRKVNTIL